MIWPCCGWSAKGSPHSSEAVFFNQRHCIFIINDERNGPTLVFHDLQSQFNRPHKVTVAKCLARIDDKKYTLDIFYQLALVHMGVDLF